MYVLGITRNPDIADALALRWVYSSFLRGILVQIAMTPNLTGETLRTFLIPPVASCTFDTGGGHWYVRVGGLVGDLVEGRVEWSGIYGPWSVMSQKPTVPPVNPRFSIVSATPSPEALQIRTDPAESTLAFWEVSNKSPDFSAADTQWFYGMGEGAFFVKGLSAGTPTWVRLHLLLVPIPMFNKSLNLVETALIGADYAIHALCSGQVASGTPMKLAKLGDSSEKAERRGDEAILHQATITPTMKFASHGDYLRFKAAAERRKA